MAYEVKDKSGQVVKRNDQVVLASDLIPQTKSVDMERRRLHIIGTDESVDRQGDIIKIKGWQMDNFLRNSVFLWAHDYASVPLAAAVKVVRKRSPWRLEFEEQFPPEGIHPFADMILNLYNLHIINASSVGFIPIKYEKRELEDDEKERYWNPRMFLEQELLELSGCAVPANPNALQNAMRSLPKGLQVVDYMRYLSGEVKTIEIEHADDVMDEIDKYARQAEFIDETEVTVHQVPDNIESGGKGADLEEEVDEITTICGEGAIEVSVEDVLKPYPNEHACRLKEPNHDRYARKNCERKHEDKCIDVIYGIKDGKSEVQALRYPKKSWSARAARNHCKGEEGSFEPASESIVETLDISFCCEDRFVIIGDDIVITMDTFDKVFGADEDEAKFGAVLSKRNKMLLLTALENIQKVLDAASQEEDSIQDIDDGGSAPGDKVSHTEAEGTSIYEHILAEEKASEDVDAAAKSVSSAGKSSRVILGAEDLAKLQILNGALKELSSVIVEKLQPTNKK